MNTTMQTLGRVAIIGGSVLVAFINLYLFTGVHHLPPAEIALIYRNVYLMALAIPLISVLGVVSATLIKRRNARRLRRQGYSRAAGRSDAQPARRDHAAQLVDPGRQPAVRGLHAGGRPRGDCRTARRSSLPVRSRSSRS